MGFPGFFFPFGIPKVQRSADLVDIETSCKMRRFSIPGLSLQPRKSAQNFDSWIVELDAE